MKFVNDHPFNDPDAAARKFVEIANDVEAVQDGRQLRRASRFSILHEKSSACVIGQPQAGFWGVLAKGVRPVNELNHRQVTLR
jgi:hypothetical protein